VARPLNNGTAPGPSEIDSPLPTFTSPPRRLGAFVADTSSATSTLVMCESAILSGASIILPSTETSVETTIAALQNQACTILIADSHITKVLVADDVSATKAPSLRGGLVKVGSGESISDGPGAVPLFNGRATLSAVGTPRN
jgi:hypothetical protein